MTPIFGVALHVLPNEPAYALSEVNLKTPDEKAWHRYQRIAVVRNDAISMSVRDMGPASAYTAPQFRIIGGDVDDINGRGIAWETVASIQDMAEQMRKDPQQDDWDEIPGWTADQYLEAYDDERDRRNRALTGRRTYGALSKGKR